jgi:hypothetical protein
VVLWFENNEQCVDFNLLGFAYKYQRINNRSDVAPDKPQANKKVPHLRSGWVLLMPLLQSYRTYGLKKKNPKNNPNRQLIGC